MTDLYGIAEVISQFRVTTRNFLHLDSVTGQESLKSLAIRFWFESLRRRTGLATAYSLEQFFEPSSFKRDRHDSITSYRNKWIRYEDGIHRPQRGLLLLVEEKLHGSSRDLNHPLWKVLDLSDQKVMQGEGFLRTLAPSVQAILFSPEDDAPLIQSGRLPVTHVLLNRLVRNANLDGLACLAWLLREAGREGYETAGICHAIHHVMLMLAMDLHAMNVANSILQIVTERILSLAMPEHHRIALTIDEYIEASKMLNVIVYFTPAGKKRSLPWSKRARIMMQLLDGKFGVDVFHALRGPFTIDERSAHLTDELRSDGARRLKYRAWGWDCLRNKKDPDITTMP